MKPSFVAIRKINPLGVDDLPSTTNSRSETGRNSQSVRPSISGYYRKSPFPPMTIASNVDRLVNRGNRSSNAVDQIPEPEPDYSLTDSESASFSDVRHQPNFWANSTDYHHRQIAHQPSTTHIQQSTPGVTHVHKIVVPDNDHDDRHHSDRDNFPYHSPHRRPPSKTVSRSISRDEDNQVLRDDHPDRHPSDQPSLRDLHPQNKTAEQTDNRRRSVSNHIELTTRTRSGNGGLTGVHQDNNGGGILASKTAVSNSDTNAGFSSFNILKRVNDRYKRTERLLLQLRLVGILHTVFGLAMLSLDCSQVIVLWPHIVDVEQRLFLCLRGFYAVLVVTIGATTISIAYARNLTLIDLVKLISAVLLTTIVVAPKHTSLFENLAGALDQNHFQKRQLQLTDAGAFKRWQAGLAQAANFENFAEALTQKSAQNSTTIIQDNQTTTTPVVEPAVIAPTGIERSQAFRIVQHIRVAYCILGFCHIVLTLATLIITIKLSQLLR